MRQAVRAIVLRDDKMLVMHRNKFGQEYDTLVGGGIDFGETAEQALYREIKEETGVAISAPRLVFIEEAGEPYGTQYIYLCQDAGGEAMLAEDSEEAQIHALGKNLYTPTWLPLAELPNRPFVSEQLKTALLHAFAQGFPQTPITITSHK